MVHVRTFHHRKDPFDCECHTEIKRGNFPEKNESVQNSNSKRRSLKDQKMIKLYSLSFKNKVVESDDKMGYDM